MIQTPIEISEALEAQRVRLKRSRGDLVEGTGLSYQSLQKILDGTADFKVSSLLAVAAALGMDVALVPRGLGTALAAAEPAAPFGAPATPAAPAAPAAPGMVNAALARLKPLGGPS